MWRKSQKNHGGDLDTDRKVWQQAFLGVSKLKFKFERDIKQLKDLEGLTVDQMREVLVKMGAKFEPIPEVELGNLAYPKNIHASWYVREGPCIHKKTDKGFTAVLGSGFDPEWEIDKNLVVKSMNSVESLKRYANMIKEEFAHLTDDQLRVFNPMGIKSLARARDECLRRGLFKEASSL